jgi:bifunctional DNase/RNase
MVRACLSDPARGFIFPLAAPSAASIPVPIQIELKRIIINEINEDQIVVLGEVDGERSLPIVIGLFEATSIDRRVKGMPSPRPLTHDLVVNAIDMLGGEIQDVMISDLESNTYFAKLRVRQAGELVEIDCRPSDAIAIAVTAQVPIYVNESVMGEALDD